MLQDRATWLSSMTEEPFLPSGPLYNTQNKVPHKPQTHPKIPHFSLPPLTPLISKTTMSHITSLPITSTIDRVAEANSIRELSELMSINVRPQLAAICEECFRTSQKPASVVDSLDDLKKAKDASRIPSQISVRPYVPQVTKDMLGAGAFRAAKPAL